MTAGCRIVRIFNKTHLSINIFQIYSCVLQCFRVCNNQFCFFLNQSFSYEYGRAFSGVSGIGFKSKTKKTNFFSGECVKHRSEHIEHKSSHLILIYLYYTFPVISHFVKTVMSTKVDQVKYIFFKARSTKTDTCI